MVVYLLAGLIALGVTGAFTSPIAGTAGTGGPTSYDVIMPSGG
jgi:hypothetical protein